MSVSRGGNTIIQLATSMALIRIAVLLLAVVAGATAAPLPYNEGANAPVEIERALSKAEILRLYLLLAPRKTDIAVGKVVLLWTPWRTGADGFPAPAA